MLEGKIFVINRKAYYFSLYKLEEYLQGCVPLRLQDQNNRKEKEKEKNKIG